MSFPCPKNLVLVAVLSLFVLAPPVSADGAKVDERLKALEAKVGALEKKVDLLVARGAAQAKSGADEQQAQALYNEITGLVVNDKIPEAKAKIAEFNSKYSSSKVASRVRRLNQELGVIGKDAPADYNIETWLQGEGEVDLTSGKTTLVVFWEVWCPYCKREVPKLQQTYVKYKDRGLQVVGLMKMSRSTTAESVLAFVKERGVEYPVAKENGQASAYFAVSGVPAAAVVKDGKIVWRGHPARLTDAMLEGWL